MTAWQGLWTWADVRPCGTLAAYRRHQRHGEPPCESCKQARARYRQDRRRQRRAEDSAERRAA